jgi:hypothetical protein
MRDMKASSTQISPMQSVSSTPATRRSSRRRCADPAAGPQSKIAGAQQFDASAESGIIGRAPGTTSTCCADDLSGAPFCSRCSSRSGIAQAQTRAVTAQRTPAHVQTGFATY